MPETKPIPLTRTITDLEALRDALDSALADAQSAQEDADESSTPTSESDPFTWTEDEWRLDGFGAQHPQVLWLLDLARVYFHMVDDPCLEGNMREPVPACTFQPEDRRFYWWRNDPTGHWLIVMARNRRYLMPGFMEQKRQEEMKGEILPAPLPVPGQPSLNYDDARQKT